MTLRDLRARVRDDRVIGTVVSIPSAAVVEALGPSQYDAICIDAEHAPLSVDRLEALLVASDLAGKAAIVRVPEVGHYISRVLDLGAAGVIIPRVETGEDAREAVERTRFAPEGKRGVGAGRGAAYGAHLIEYVARANAQVMLAIQIETRDGLLAIDEILAVPGIDAVVVGPFDLATSLGTEFGSDEHERAISQILDAADRWGVAKGAFVTGGENARKYIEAGASLLFNGHDIYSIAAEAERSWNDLAAFL